MSAINLTRLYRAHIGAGPARPERTAFVEADSPESALLKTSKIVGMLDGRDSELIIELIYNCRPASDLLKAGHSEDPYLRIFEAGRTPHGLLFIEHPLFLVADSAPLIRKWMATQAVRP